MTAVVPGRTPGFFRGLSMPFRGVGFMAKNIGLARIWIIPVVIVVGLLIGGCVISGHVASILADRIAPMADANADLGRHLGAGFGHALTRGVFAFIGALVSILVSVLLAPVIAAPFNDMLGEEVERIELGKNPPPFSWSRLSRDIGRTVRIELTKMVVYAVLVLPLWFGGFVAPPLAAASSALGFVLTAAYFALDYVDGPLTRRSVGVRRRFQLFVKHPAALLGFGLGVWFLLFIPLLNLFFMPAAVAGGTRLCADLGLLDEVESTPEG